ncbi:type II 3-dehydroquinate dehydratase [Glaciecola sp. KUL10]|uniref:type II 3-dehydroquinate dehydratase n=1 Tax=Glaciecola sp. (strain KUL10) TaxID=2161813 RepID=UPI000D7825D8|nr:type II 3-dehydroquinate dehydratase [Glaciecola sp. KUL10]GBL04427.1 3-dehydroquinate dehydratase [Glaciecola sp. KUL10]
MKILVLNGPNLNLLGKREPDIYGTRNLAQIMSTLRENTRDLTVQIDDFQSNSETDLIERVQSLFDEGNAVDGIVINPAAYTHTSVALRDALSAVGVPFVEVHLSNVHAREAFRHHSYFSDIAVGVIAGLGEKGYEFAVRALYEIEQN